MTSPSDEMFDIIKQNKDHPARVEFRSYLGNHPEIAILFPIEGGMEPNDYGPILKPIYEHMKSKGFPLTQTGFAIAAENYEMHRKLPDGA